MSSRRIRAVVFDAVGTLIYPDPPVARAYAEQGRRFGSRLAEAEVLPRFQAAFAALERLDREPGGERTSDSREQERWRQIVGAVFSDVPDCEPLFASLWQHFREARHWRLFDDVEPIWAELRRLKLRLAVASNFDSRLTDICRALPPLDRDVSLFVSSQLGVRKPSRQFFDAVAAGLNCLPEEVLMVGDDDESDYRAALAAGWRALLVDRRALTSTDHVLAWLTDLPDRLA